jgi:hypothetical protein
MRLVNESSFATNAIGIIYDAANAHFIDEGIRAGLARCNDRLRLMLPSDTGPQAYRHNPVEQGFYELPAALSAVGYRTHPMLEFISIDADRDIIDSVDQLAGMGVPNARTAAPLQVRIQHLQLGS